MSWKEMAPWIAIVVTLIISIITPLITQIINNRFSLKIKKQEQIKSVKKEKYQIACDFAEKVGACIVYWDEAGIKEAGASINKMYLIMPEKSWSELGFLYSLLREHNWDKSETVFRNLCKEVSKLLSEQNQEDN